MASGKQIAEENFQRFTAWLDSKTNDDFRQMVNKREGRLSRKEIVAECGFGASAITQNPRINKALGEKEIELRELGVLPPLVEKVDGSDVLAPLAVAVRAAKSFDAERVRRLELENASLKAENQELKNQLSKFAILREVLSNTGRLLR